MKKLLTSWLEKSPKLAISIIVGIPSVLVVLISLLGINVYVSGIADDRITAKLSSTEFKTSIVRELGANIVFNGAGSVLNDPQRFASDYVETIEVRSADLNSGTPACVITIRLKRFVEIEPILKCYNATALANGKRVGTFDWQFAVILQTDVGIITPKNLASDEIRYLLTIVR